MSHAAPITTHDWHEQDRAFLRSLRSSPLSWLRKTRVTLRRIQAPSWQVIAVEREIVRRQVSARGAA